MANKDVYTFDEDSTRRIAREVFKHEREALLQHLHRSLPRFAGQEERRVRFRNTSGEVIPARAVMRVTGVERRFDKACFTVAKPNAEFLPLYLVNGNKPVAAGEKAFHWGRWMIEGVGRVLADLQTGTPEKGYRWGPKDGSWKLAADYQGFSVRFPTTGTTHYDDDYVWATQDNILNDTVAFYNDSGETIPAFGVMEMLDEYDDAGRVKVIKPSTTFCRRYLVNTFHDVGADCPGHGTFLERAPSNTLSSRVLCATSPDFGDEYGVAPGEWALESYRPGFQMFGNVQAAGEVYSVRAMQREVVRHEGYLIDGAITAGGSADFQIWKGPVGTGGAEAGWELVECWNSGCDDIDNDGADLWGAIVWQNGEWLYEPICCPANEAS